MKIIAYFVALILQRLCCYHVSESFKSLPGGLSYRKGQIESSWKGRLLFYAKSFIYIDGQVRGKQEVRFRQNK